VDVHLDFVESELARRAWFAGDALSAADIMMSFPLEAARSRAGLDAGRPATIAWLEKIHARPAYQAALARGRPYAYAYGGGGPGGAIRTAAMSRASGRTQEGVRVSRI